MGIGKVTAFIIREKDNIKDILVFRHPYAGIQFPSGTMEANETTGEALRREVQEETGLTEIEIRKYIGMLKTRTQEDEYFIAEKCKAYSRPDSTSFDWVDFRKGITVTAERSAAEFTQVTYVEHDRFPHPTYVTYQITGWVSTTVLTKTTIRHFFHVITPYDGRTEWDIFTDNHLMRLFWVPLATLRSIIGYQLKYYDYVVEELGYTF